MLCAFLASRVLHVNPSLPAVWWAISWCLQNNPLPTSSTQFFSPVCSGGSLSSSVKTSSADSWTPTVARGRVFPPRTWLPSLSGRTVLKCRFAVSNAHSNASSRRVTSHGANGRSGSGNGITGTPGPTRSGCCNSTVPPPLLGLLLRRLKEKPSDGPKRQRRLYIIYVFLLQINTHLERSGKLLRNLTGKALCRSPGGPARGSNPLQGHRVGAMPLRRSVGPCSGQQRRVLDGSNRWQKRQANRKPGPKVSFVSLGWRQGTWSRTPCSLPR